VYRRRRRVVGALVAVILVALGVGAQAAVGGPSGGPASAAGTGSIGVQSRSVLVRPGDSLWAIAAEHHGDVDIRHYLDALIELNDGTVIHVGQLVTLP